jgi:hypothetical protein
MHDDDILLQLHCPQCATIVDVVTEGENLVCLDCGWKFDERVAAKFLERAAPPADPRRPAASART